MCACQKPLLTPSLYLWEIQLYDLMIKLCLSRYDSYEEYQHERLKREEYRKEYEKRESERAKQRERQRQKAIVSAMQITFILKEICFSFVDYYFF